MHPNASPPEWVWVVVYTLAWLFSGLRMWWLARREQDRQRAKSNGALRWFSWGQIVLTAFFMGTEIRAIALGGIAMTRPSGAALSNAAWMFIEHAVEMMLLQGFILYVDQRIRYYVNRAGGKDAD